MVIDEETNRARGRGPSGLETKYLSGRAACGWSGLETKLW